jgi:tRNA dimethylallyltransferase
MLIKKNKIIVILGPTASGKTKLAVALAYKFNGEIVSADSRQVYKGMDAGTGKDLGNYQLSIINYQSGKKIKKIIKIPHYLIDVVSPKTNFNLAKYQKFAYKAIDDILTRRKLPIVVGGTGLYLQAVVQGYQLSEAKPDKKLREKLEKMSAQKLFKMLSGLDYKKANGLNESDKKNKRRLIRYIEVAKSGFAARTVEPLKQQYEFLLIGVKKNREETRKRIYKRLIERLEKEDMVGEIQKLREQGLSWKRLESFGLEYKFISLYLQGKLDYKEMVEQLNIAIGQFAKRQLSWFRRWERQGAKIYWIESRQAAIKLVNQYF